MPAIEPSSAEHYHSLFLEALENYKKKTGRDPVAHTLVAQLNTSPEEVTRLLQEEAERLDAVHKSRWRTRMCEKIAPIVEIIRPLCDTAGKATGLAFKPGETIFGVIGILLTIPDNYKKNHEALMGLLEQMTHFLGRLRTLIVPEDVPFDDAMTKIIVDILVELIRAFALLTERMSPSDGFIPMAKRRLRKALATFSGDKEVESMLKRLDELTKVEHLMATAETRRDIAIVKREQRRQERMQRAERYQKWLSVPNSSTNQATASEARYSDTSMWLVRGQAYEEWKSSGTLLWVTGKPGAGKTVICSTVIKDLQDSLRSSGSSTTLAYFYCDFRDTNKQSYRSLLGSLLIDLSTQSDVSDNLLHDLFSKYEDGSREPDANDLMDCLKEMLVQSDGTRYIVVDALDEMPNYGVSSSRAKSLELVSNLMSLGLSGLQICITSRPEDDIGHVLRPLTHRQVVIDQEKRHHDDITRLIRSVIESNPKTRAWGEAIREEVIGALSEKADGMFRYVSCQLDTLCECPMSKIRPTLKSLPTTLHATYEATLERISEEKWDYAHRLFQCLSFSTRPLYVEELAEVLAVSLDEEIPTYHNDWRSDDPESVVLSTCPGNFIQVITEHQWHHSSPQRIVQFTHFSVKEFLASDPLSHSKANVSRFRVLPGPSHAVLARTCLGILLRPNDAPTVEQSTSTEPHPVQYAVDFWDEHARFDDVSMSLLKAMGLLFDPTKPHFAFWARLRERRHQDQPGTPLYFAALCGLPPIVERILASGSHNVNARGGQHKTALRAAVGVGSPTTIKLLLDCGADIDAQGDHYGSALYVATAHGKLDITRLLLDCGANVNAQGGFYQSALHAATKNGDLDTVQLLLNRGADVNSHTDLYRSTLHAATAHGNLDIIQLLLDRGADINAQSDLDGSALQKAAGDGKLDVVQLLLNRGADIDACASGGGCALRRAVAGGRPDIVELLLNSGADANAQGGVYGSALQTAVEQDKLNFIQLLLNHGADVNFAQGGIYGSALHAATARGKLDTIQLLLDCGADVNDQGGPYGCPLHAVAAHGKLDIVQLLLDRGADVNGRGGLYGSALQAAAENGKLDTVQLLLDRGANIDARVGRYRSALHAAAAHGKFDIVELLLDRGTDVNGQGGLYGSALQAAAENGKLDIVGLLLDRGADIDARVGRYGSALHAAAAHGELEVVQLLLDRGADINVQGHKYGSVLHAAATGGGLKVVQLLLDNGADINTQGGLYGNVLQAAACNPQDETDVVQFFLNRGIDVNTQGGMYGTALIGASRKENPDIVQLLLAYGADTSIKSDKYGTALEAARIRHPFHMMDDQKRTTVVELLSSVSWQDANVVLPNGDTGSSTQWSPGEEYFDGDSEYMLR